MSARELSILRGTRCAAAAAVAMAAAACAGGCTGRQAALDPAGSNAGHVEGLWWLFFWVCVVVYVLTMAVILIAYVRGRRGREPVAAAAPETQPEPLRERRLAAVVTVALGVTVVTLFVLMIGDFVTGRAVASQSGDPNPLTIRVTARQWWWEARYEDGMPSEMFTTANELHVPVGRIVKFDLSSMDVIHSFWVPNLSGKKDMIPGHPTSLYVKAERAGTYFGQCAEFCGLQHAKMRLVVVAEPPEQYAAWRAAQLQNAAEPQTDAQRHGRDVFLNTTCIMCHSISGTHARGRVGPDLTHVGSRQLIVANSLPNTPGYLAGWITDPQKIKPGVRMPQHALAPEDLRALLEYLESLK
jgi:cytochrome c oxidase subunit II